MVDTLVKMPNRINPGPDQHGENPMLLIRPKFRRFIEHYVKHGNIDAAEEYAGVKPRCGWWGKHSQKPMVKHAYEHYRKAWMEKFARTDTEIAAEIDRVAMIRDEELVEGYTPRDKISALKLAAQAKGLLKQNLHITGGVTMEHVVADVWAKRAASKAIDVSVEEVPEAQA